MAAFILIGSSSAIAQSTVIGKVVDENDAPLIGATVIVPGTSTVPEPTQPATSR